MDWTYFSRHSIPSNMKWFTTTQSTQDILSPFSSLCVLRMKTNCFPPPNWHSLGKEYYYVLQPSVFFVKHILGQFQFFEEFPLFQSCFLCGSPTLHLFLKPIFRDHQGVKIICTKCHHIILGALWVPGNK